MKKITLTLFWMFFATVMVSQNRPTGKRISISNPTHQQLHFLKDAGIDLSCGANFTNNNVILELSDDM